MAKPHTEHEGPKRRRRILTTKRVVAKLVSERQFSEFRRYELGVEALCELAVDATLCLGRGVRNVSPDLMCRLSGITLAAWGEDVPADLSRWTYSIRLPKFIWMCLSRVLELTSLLALHDPRAQWNQVHETVEAWLDSWGDDERAKMARTRFSTLTGITQGQEARAQYMHSSLVRALSAVQA